MSSGTWRPANIKNLPPEAAHVINQAVREINARIDVLNDLRRPHIRATSHVVFGTLPANTAVDITMNVPGANTTGAVHASPAQGLDPGANLIWSAKVSAQGQVKIRLLNPTGSAVVVPTIPWNVSVSL